MANWAIWPLLRLYLRDPPLVAPTSMPYTYATILYWIEIKDLPASVRPARLASEADRLAEFLKNDTDAVAVWEAFLGCDENADAEIYQWLLSLRPDARFLRRSTPFEYRGREYNGCTLVQLSLLTKPSHGYLDLLADLIPECDAEGNSTLLYVALSNNFSLYERIWKALGADGERSRRPGPESAAVLVKADWNSLMKREISWPHLIESLGGFKAALELALKENSSAFANEVLKAYKDVNWDEFVRMAMTEEFVEFNSFMAVLDQAALKEKSLPFSIDAILRRAYALCRKNTHYLHFLRSAKSMKEILALPESLDELVAFTGSPYKLLHYVHKYPTVLNTLNKIGAGSKSVPPEVFDLKSAELGSYLHVVCKRIGQYEHYHSNRSLHPVALNVWYLPHLLELTKDEHWKVVDAHGKKPVDNLGAAVRVIDPSYMNEIRRRSASGLMLYYCLLIPVFSWLFCIGRF